MIMNYNKVENIYLKLLKVNYLLSNNVSKIAKQYDFSSSELMIYLDIKTHPNTDLNGLCDRLGLKKSAASKAINKLIKNDHVNSQTNPEDQRKVSLNYVEQENATICKETMLNKTFSGISNNDCNLNTIEQSLDEIIKMLSNEQHNK